MQTVIEVANPQRLTGIGGAVYNGPGALMGIFVSQAAAAPTITVYDGVSAAAPATILVNTFTPVAGVFYPMPFFVGRGIFVVLGGNVDCTVGFRSETA